MARSTTAVETRQDRTQLAHEAGYGTVSLTSTAAGAVCAYGTFALLSAIAGGILAAIGFDGEQLRGNWRDWGIGTAIVAGVVLFLAWAFGGYVTGRMARRAGARNGLAMFVLSVLVLAAVGLLIGLSADATVFADDLRRLGVPTTWNEWSAIASIAGAASLLGMLVGAIVGAIAGERWHGKLLTRAATTEPREIDLREPAPTITGSESERDRDRESGDGSDGHPDGGGQQQGMDLGEGEFHTHADGTMHAHRR